jgi:hypothetical protein
MSFIYLASPYTDHDPLIVQQRFELAEEAVAEMLRIHMPVYSPIVHCHELAKKFNLPKDFEFWKEYNLSMLEAARELHILRLPGWKESRGVRAESNFALMHGIPVAYRDLNITEGLEKVV